MFLLSCSLCFKKRLVSLELADPVGLTDCLPSLTDSPISVSQALRLWLYTTTSCVYVGAGHVRTLLSELSLQTLKNTFQSNQQCG